MPRHHGVSVGDVLTRQTAVSGVALNAPLPPSLPPRLVLLLVPSPAYAVSVAVPRKPAFGTKRSRSVAVSSSALLGDAVEMVVHVMPSSEYCQVPLLVPVMPVTAMPTVTPGSAKKGPNTAATVSFGCGWPGTTGVSAAPLPFQAGA